MQKDRALRCCPEGVSNFRQGELGTVGFVGAIFREYFGENVGFVSSNNGKFGGLGWRCLDG